MKKKKFLTTLACFGITAVTALGFVGCGSSNPVTIFSNDFSNGNNGTFVSTNITDNEDGSITLNDMTNPSGNATQNYTYFGTGTDKNLPWEKGGMTLSLKMKVDGENMQSGDYIVWSLALNENDGTYLTEAPTFFVKDDEAVKFVYEFTGVDQYPTVTASENAVALTDGWYEINYIFTEENNGDLQLEVTLEDESGNEVYSSTKQNITVIDPTIHEGKDYTSETVVNSSMVKGFRYLWLTRNSVTVTLDSITVTK